MLGRRKNRRDLRLNDLLDSDDDDDPDDPDRKGHLEGEMVKEKSAKKNGNGKGKKKNQKRRPKRLSDAERKAIRQTAQQKAAEIGIKGRKTIALLEDEVNERFKLCRHMILAVVQGRLNGMIIAGAGGIGKSYMILEILRALNFKEGKDYLFMKNKVTSFALYHSAVDWRNGGLIILDDTTTWTDQHIELIKSMCDTNEPRVINWKSIGKAHSGDADTLVKEGKLPDRIEFKGRMIVITNLTEDQIPQTLLSRCAVIPLAMTESEKLERMRTILKKMNPDMDLAFRREVMDALIEQYELERKWAEDPKMGKIDVQPLCLRSLKKLLDYAKGDPEGWRDYLKIAF